jgi:AAA15 family ATPase/GTPase
MIKYFTVENFYSIGNESVLEFDLHIKKDAAFLAHPTIGFAGSNASGKSNVLKALSFVLWFASNSFWKIAPKPTQMQYGEPANWNIPIEAFIAYNKQPSKFHIIFTKDEIDYEYLLTVNTEKVFEEEFYYYPKKRQKLIYRRKELSVRFGDGISKFDTKDLRENCSIISFAAQFQTQEQAKTVREYNVFPTNIPAGQPFRDIGFSIPIMFHLAKDEKTKHNTTELLKLADVGISDFLFLKSEEMDKFIKENNKDIKQNNVNQVKGNSFVTSVFTHNIEGKPMSLFPDQQSEGTRKILVLFSLVTEALENGSLIILDEIEAKLHQNLVAYIIGLFQNPEVNTKSAQLIFAFHNTSLMEILKPEQLWFVEKNENGHSEFYCAANVQGIKDLHKKSLETLYRIGRFGATPKLL